MQRRQKMKRIEFVVLFVGFLITLTACTATIADNERGVYFDRNGNAHLLEPGQHFLGWEPVDVHIVSTEVQTYTMTTASGGDLTGNDSVEARSVDGLRLFVDAEVVFQIIPDKAVELVKSFGGDQSQYVSELVRPTARTIIYNTAVKYKSVDIVGNQRDKAEADMNQQLAEQLQQFGIRLIKLKLLKVMNG